MNKFNGLAAFALTGILGATTISTAFAEPPLLVAGWVEKAVLYPGSLRYGAKLDTGANTSSIHAPDAEVYGKKGKRRVRFSLKDDTGLEAKFDLPVVRISITRDMTGPSIKRPVVLLDICVGGIRAPAEVNLSNRPNFSYALLIGRQFMEGRMVIDSGRTNMHPEKCPMEAK